MNHILNIIIDGRYKKKIITKKPNAGLIDHANVFMSPLTIESIDIPKPTRVINKKKAAGIMRIVGTIVHKIKNIILNLPSFIFFNLHKQLFQPNFLINIKSL